MHEQTIVKKVLFWVFTLLLPVIILLVIELLLRLGGYNKTEQKLFVDAPMQSEYLTTNPLFFNRYFPSFTPSVAPNTFLKNKEPNTFRVFVLGGSSTEGFPYNYYNSFSGRLEQKLLVDTQGLHIEVINLGATAVNSYVIWDLRKSIMKYEPDAILIYSGHNEYYGSFGVGSSQFGLGDKIWLKRTILTLKNSVLYQFLESIIKPKTPDISEDRTMMAQVVSDSDITFNGEVFQSGVVQFNNNISDVISYFKDKNVPIYIGTIASKLKDQAPLGENDEAVKVYNEGEALYEANEKERAYSKFEEAKELDPIRFRAPSAINDIIRGFEERSKVMIVDVEQLAIDSSKSGIPDSSFFIDHLHPNWKAHQYIGELFFDEMMKDSRLKKYYAPNSVATRPEISEFEETYGTVPILRLTAGYPFVKGLSQDEELAIFKRRYNALLTNNYEDSLATRTWLNQEPVPLALTKVVEMNIAKYDTLNMARSYMSLAHWHIFSEALLKKGVEYPINNRRSDSYNVLTLHLILSKKRTDPFFVNKLAGIYMFNNDFERAEYYLNESKKLNPTSAELMLNYSRFYILQGDTVTATRYFQRYRSSR